MLALNPRVVEAVWAASRSSSSNGLTGGPLTRPSARVLSCQSFVLGGRVRSIWQIGLYGRTVG